MPRRSVVSRVRMPWLSHLKGLSASDWLPLTIFLTFLVICFIGGGSAREDVYSLLFLRPVAVIAIVSLLLAPGQKAWQTFRFPLTVLAALAIVMVLQLVPLPPAIWTNLPGHQLFVEAARAAGESQPWRPISISPERTLNSLVSLVIPLAALVGMASISRRQTYLLVPVLIAVAMVSAILGVAQLAGGAGSDLRFYRVTNDTAAVGLFANRNHQALLLVCAIPLLLIWIGLRPGIVKSMHARLGLAVAMLLFIVPTVLVTGSRAGLILACISFISAWLLFGRKLSIRWPRWASRWRWLFRWIPWLLGAGIIAAVTFLARDVAFRRLAEGDYLSESRLTTIPSLLELLGRYVPFGSGFGTFDPAYRIVEPLSELRPTYLNHAHNDLLELGITAGMPGLLILAAFLFWWVRKLIAVVRQRSVMGEDRAKLGLCGSLIMLLLLIASLVDYQLRTPSLAALFTIACCWLCLAARPAGSISTERGGRRP